jgi:thiamine kinase-like enzyme
MIIGVDFDNTIVCYDGIFHRVALERGLIPADLPQDKTTVRNHLRQIGREPDWTEMQGYVYGPRLIDAQAYPGVLDFFRAAVKQGVEVRIVSHKTKHPFLGEQHDLHAAAWGWLEANGFFDPARIGMLRDQVFLELTKESKHKRIGTLGCTHFIDDLPEFLLDPGFPAGVERIHFNPCGTAKPENGLRSTQSWVQITGELLINPAVLDLAHSVLPGAELHLKAISGGANNRIFHATGASGEVIIKAYHHSTADQRDRFAAEQRFYHLELPATPKPLAWDAENRLGAFSVIHGRKLTTDEVTAENVQQCIDWICGIQQARQHHAAADVALAADACLSIEDHIALVERRVKRLWETGEDHGEFRSFVSEALAPHVEDMAARIREEASVMLDVPLFMEQRVLSPSDFGFHNALKDDAGRLWFFDFEYAGWDDPAKLLCDFFCQPQVPVSIEHAERFVETMQVAVRDEALPARFKLLLPLHAAKWACILLNEFLKTDAERRRFAGLQDRRADQLEKARTMLAFSTSLC